MSRVINVNEISGKPISQEVIKRFLDNAGGQEKFAVFNDISIPETRLKQTAKDRWGDLPEDTFLWGAKTTTSQIDPDSFDQKNWNRIAKDYHQRAEVKGIVQKSLTSSSASVFVPTIIAPGVIDVIRKKTPFYAMVPKKVMTSKIMNINRRATDLTDSIDFSAEADTVLTGQDQAYTNIVVTAKLLFVAGVLTHFAQAATQETVDLFAQEVNDHFIDLIGFKEKAAIRGEVAATGTWGAHFTVANGYDGIVKRIESGASGNLVILSSQAISLAHIDKLFENIHANNGEPSAIICDPATFTRLRSMARDHKRLGANETQFGFPNFSMSIDGIPVFPTNFMPRTANQKCAIAFDINAVEYRVLVPDTFVEVAQDLSPTHKFFFEVFEAFVVTAPEWCSAVINGS